MGSTRIVPAIGAVDGVNREFLVGMPYVAGSTALLFNGRAHSWRESHGPDNLYGYVESDPDAGIIVLDHAPLDGDVIQILFEDRVYVAALPVESLAGTVSDVPTLRGTIVAPTTPVVVGTAHTKTLQATLRPAQLDRLVGQVEARALQGVLRTASGVAGPPGPQGPAGPQGEPGPQGPPGTGSTGGFAPVLIPAGTVCTVPQHSQQLVALTVDVDGVWEVDGVIVEVYA